MDIYPASARIGEETEIQALPVAGFLFLEHPSFGGKPTGVAFSPYWLVPRKSESLDKNADAPNKEQQQAADVSQADTAFS
ncbi:hypothetical protein [Agrobacterium sp. DE0009]|uniref:hypothetical protein n=1 Tax=Agrobacterium sp. DE0009 TaxID=2587505 RepID=UPI001643B271|nr:hypothetical protein [Agrobacterium sp. DE0009]